MFRRLYRDKYSDVDKFLLNSEIRIDGTMESINISSTAKKCFIISDEKENTL